MAQPYLDQLEKVVRSTGIDEIECKHFFSGAACYVEGKIFASLTPVGLALKLPEKMRNEIVKKGGRPLRYFPKAPVKRGYVVLTNEMVNNPELLNRLITESIGCAQF